MLFICIHYMFVYIRNIAFMNDSTKRSSPLQGAAARGQLRDIMPGSDFGGEALRLRDAEIQLEAETPAPAKDPQRRGAGARVQRVACGLPAGAQIYKAICIFLLG